MTNADKIRALIRALSDSEIATILHEKYCISWFDGTAECSGAGTECYDCWLDWLKQEVDDEHID